MMNFSEKLLDGKPATAFNKWLLLLLVLAVVLTLCMMLRQDDADNTLEVINQTDAVPDPIAKLTIGNMKPLKQGPILAEQSPLIPWQKLERVPIIGQPQNLFKVHSWRVIAPVKKVKPQPAPAPVAPPAPFTYVGKLDDSPTGTQFFLMENGRLFSVLKGEKIDAKWRLDNEDANNLHLTFLPLNLPQLLAKTANSVLLPAAEPAESLPDELNL